MRLVQVAFSCLTIVAIAIASAACSVASIPGTGENTTNVKGGGGASSGGTTTGPNGTQACINGEPEQIDIATLSACECKDGGKAHCLGAAKMPTNLASRLNRCDGEAGRCVPDSIITSKKPPPACKTGENKDGRCLSLCVPQVSRFAAGSCGASDERCVPCVDPFGDPTGICNDTAFDTAAPKCEDVTAGTKPAGTGIGTEAGEQLTCPFTGTPKDPSTVPACGAGGRCVGKDGIPADIAKRLRTCETGLCVPEVYVKEKGQHKPSACSSFAGIEGRCFSLVFKDVDEQKEFLQRDTCNEDERCVPCFSPATGADTQVCRTVSCDAPVTQTPPKLPDCCKQAGTQKTTGKCLPKSDIPTKFQERVEKRECDTGSVCAPSENLDPGHVTVRCDEGNAKKVCVSNCVEFGFIEGFFVGRGTCDTEHVCVPCFDITGAATGAPGC